MNVALPPVRPEVTDDTPFEVSVALPSQILRSHARRRWCRWKFRRATRDGRIQLCAIGRLADEAGFDWRHWDGRSHEQSNAAVFVRGVYRLTFDQVTAVMLHNDRTGLDAAIAFLEGRGL
ncbi:MAG TPA: hypothetical protein VF898_08795 [Chloroflexota bacterium]